MIYFIFYDIESDKLRKKVSDKLIEEGFQRLQYSVFSCPDAYTNIEIIFDDLSRIMDSSENKNDKIYFLTSSKEAVKKMRHIGELNFDIDELTGEKNTLIF